MHAAGSPSADLEPAAAGLTGPAERAAAAARVTASSIPSNPVRILSYRSSLRRLRNGPNR